MPALLRSSARPAAPSAAAEAVYRFDLTPTIPPPRRLVASSTLRINPQPLAIHSDLRSSLTLGHIVRTRQLVPHAEVVEVPISFPT